MAFWVRQRATFTKEKGVPFPLRPINSNKPYWRRETHRGVIQETVQLLWRRSQGSKVKVLPSPSAVPHSALILGFSLIYLDRQVFGFLPLLSMVLLLAPIWRSPLAWKLDILLTGKHIRFGCLCKLTKNPLQVRTRTWSSVTMKGKKRCNLRSHAIKWPISGSYLPKKQAQKPINLGLNKMNKL